MHVSSDFLSQFCRFQCMVDCAVVGMLSDGFGHTVVGNLCSSFFSARCALDSCVCLRERGGERERVCVCVLGLDFDPLDERIEILPPTGRRPASL